MTSNTTQQSQTPEKKLYNANNHFAELADNAVYMRYKGVWKPVLDGYADTDLENYFAILGNPKTGKFSELLHIKEGINTAKQNLDDGDGVVLVTPECGDQLAEFDIGSPHEWPLGVTRSTYADTTLNQLSAADQPESQVHIPDQTDLPQEALITPPEDELPQLYEVTVKSYYLPENDYWLYVDSEVPSREYQASTDWCPYLSDGMIPRDEEIVYAVAHPETGVYSHYTNPRFDGHQTVLCTSRGLVNEDMIVGNPTEHPWPTDTVRRTLGRSRLNEFMHSYNPEVDYVVDLSDNNIT